MHISNTALIAWCDAEAGPFRRRLIAGHLAKCQACRDRLELIEREKQELSAGTLAPPIDGSRDLAAIRSAMAGWQSGQNWAAAELRYRLRLQLETYFGTPALLEADRPAAGVDEMLGRTCEMLDVFLGPSAAGAVRDELLGGLRFALPEPGPWEDTSQ